MNDSDVDYLMYVSCFCRFLSKKMLGYSFTPIDSSQLFVRFNGTLFPISDYSDRIHIQWISPYCFIIKNTSDKLITIYTQTETELYWTALN